MTRAAIIAAMPGELKPFLNENAKEGWAHERRGNVHLWRLTWANGNEWVAACGGAGVAAATRAFAEVEKEGPVDLVISTGWAGALGDEFAAGRAFDVGKVVDARTGERFEASTLSHADVLLVTSPIVAGEGEKQRLTASYGGGLVDMEAAGVARLAAMRGIPFCCVKGVSDGFRDRLPDFNRFISPGGEFRLAGFILYSLMRPWHWPALVRMGENSRKAAGEIAELLYEILNERGIISKPNGYPDLQH
ncbi:MAG: nucleoside phosphorylase [Terracidiphilus sp.]|jgi:adenosylhomocysteine nucleosidase